MDGKGNHVYFPLQEEVEHLSMVNSLQMKSTQNWNTQELVFSPWLTVDPIQMAVNSSLH